jgi:hypothetical protein
MEQTECSKTSAIKHHMPQNNPKGYTQHTEHGESLKSSLYTIRALLAHLQELLHKQQLVFCVRVMSVVCYHSNPGSRQQT